LVDPKGNAYALRGWHWKTGRERATGPIVLKHTHLLVNVCCWLRWPRCTRLTIRFSPIAESFEEFLDSILADPADFLNHLGCYTRYSDGKTDIQWIPKEYVAG
jgi:hypothetical protein